MPNNPSLKARLPEWTTVLNALDCYRTHLEERQKHLNAECDEYLVAYDELERLDFLIPNLTKQVAEATEHSAGTSPKPESAIR